MDTDFISKITVLIDKYRTQCLWYFDVNFYPKTPLQMLKTLEGIESHADTKGYIEARKLKEWLLQNYKIPSAV